MALAEPKGLSLSSESDSDDDDDESWWSGIFSAIFSISDSGWRVWSAMDLCHTREIARVSERNEKMDGTSKASQSKVSVFHREKTETEGVREK